MGLWLLPHLLMSGVRGTEHIVFRHAGSYLAMAYFLLGTAHGGLLTLLNEKIACQYYNTDRWLKVTCVISFPPAGVLVTHHELS